MRPDALFLLACLLSMPAIVRRRFSSLVSFCEMSNGLRKLMLTPFFSLKEKGFWLNLKSKFTAKSALSLDFVYFCTKKRCKIILLHNIKDTDKTKKDMNKTRWTTTLISALLLLASPSANARKWTLQECIDYALAHNIQLRRNLLSRQSAHEDVLQSKAELLPSLTASTSQNVSYNPFPESGRQQVANGYVEMTTDKVYYNGSYAVSFDWTIWNGNQNRMKIQQNQLTEQQAELDSAITANSIQEQIAQIYVQILYIHEALKVNRQSLEYSQANEQRGKEMVEVGQFSQADLAQLSAQRASDEYNVVAQESNLRDYTRQLKQILQLTDDGEDFEVSIPDDVTGDALSEIPGLQIVYNHALASRPELRQQRLAIESGELSVRMAKASRLPTVSMQGGVSTNVTTMSDAAYGSQLKTNLTTSAGLTLSVPIFDRRETRTAINKANIAMETSRLALEEQQTTLYSTIESYWIQAVNNQAKYKSALANTESQQTSYELLSEQFRLGLKNIAELREAKENLLVAQQNELQSKYLALYNMQMLNFYNGK